MLDSRQPAWLQSRTLNLAGFFWCLTLMVYALFVQYALHEEPCPLCILQRIAVIVAGLLFLVAWVHNPPRQFMQRTYAVLIVLATIAGVFVAARHIQVINAPAGSVAECGASLSYMMEVLPLREVLDKVLSGSGECAKVKWQFLGLSMPFWVLLNLLALAVLGVMANWRKR